VRILPGDHSGLHLSPKQNKLFGARGFSTVYLGPSRQGTCAKAPALLKPAEAIREADQELSIDQVLIVRTSPCAETRATALDLSTGGERRDYSALRASPLRVLGKPVTPGSCHHSSTEDAKQLAYPTVVILLFREHPTRVDSGRSTARLELMSAAREGFEPSKGF
jgi:hypothetical protein